MSDKTCKWTALHGWYDTDFKSECGYKCCPCGGKHTVCPKCKKKIEYIKGPWVQDWDFCSRCKTPDYLCSCNKEQRAIESKRQEKAFRDQQLKYKKRKRKIKTKGYTGEL